MPPARSSGRALAAIDGAIALIAVLLLVQMWLLSASLESYLAGHVDAAVPGAVISAVLCLGCVGLYLFVRRVDARTRRGSEADER